MGPESELTDEFLALVDELEILINKQIDRHFTVGEIRIDLGRKAGKYLVRERLKQKYLDAGWGNVEFLFRSGGAVRIVLCEKRTSK